jgi:hypothetical protein
MVIFCEGILQQHARDWLEENEVPAAYPGFD